MSTTSRQEIAAALRRSRRLVQRMAGRAMARIKASRDKLGRRFERRAMADIETAILFARRAVTLSAQLRELEASES